MDAFGIGNGVQGAVNIYCQSARRTGRTTALVESLKDGDRVVFTDRREADRVRQMCTELGVTIITMVVDPNKPDAVFSAGSSAGRTVFDHSWVEQYYMNAIARAQKDIDHFQRETSGFGMAHIETSIKAKEIAKWRV